MVLGMAWHGWRLQEKSELIGDKYMKIRHEGSELTIKGDPSLLCSQGSLKSLSKESNLEFGGVIQALDIPSPKKDIHPVLSELHTEQLQLLLQSYKDVFSDITAFPAERDIDHAIITQPGAGPVRVRPYQYAYHQKDEMEQMVHEMLLAVVIQPSSTPYSSLTILARKMDDRWRFCVDYQALNSITVPNKYPIPVIEEPINEL